MANGSIVLSQGRWEGHITIGGVDVITRFEVFPSGGSWSVLIGKLLLMALEAKHEYTNDTIELPSSKGTIILENKITKLDDKAWGKPSDAHLTLDIKQHAMLWGDDKSPARQVAHAIIPFAPDTSDKHQTTETQPTNHVSPTTHKLAHQDETVDLPEIKPHEDPSIYTQHTNAWKTEHTNELLRLVKIGEDLTAGEHTKVEVLILEFADCFAMSVSEVSLVRSATHRLNLPTGTKIP